MRVSPTEFRATSTSHHHPNTPNVIDIPAATLTALPVSSVFLTTWCCRRRHRRGPSNESADNNHAHPQQQ
jgi:hypothetical protein